jgi:orsellinic acid/F9775 biosynthesis protein OrsD
MAINIVPPQISYLQCHQIIICVKCQTAVRPGNGFETHWRHRHQLHGHSLQALLHYLSTLTVRDPRQVYLPPRGSRVIPELGAPLRGFSCPDCEFLTVNKKNWQRHTSQNHHGGGSPATQHMVKLQTFSRGRHARYWVVHDEREEDVKTGRDGAQGPPDDVFHRLLRTYEKKYNAQWQERQRIADNPQGVENQSRWVQYMGWAGLFDRKDKRMIYLTGLMARRAGVRTPAHRQSDHGAMRPASDGGAARVAALAQQHRPDEARGETIRTQAE